MTEKEHDKYLKYLRGKQRGFIDKCFIAVTIFNCILAISSYIAVILSGKLGITDTSPLTATIEKAFELQMVFTGFIVWKAKVENCRKHKDVNRLESLESEDV